MSNGREIGEVSEKRGDLEIEWAICNIFSYTKEDKYYNSRKFSVSGCKFFLQIYPYGHTKHDSVGWISLYLMHEDDSSSRTSVNYSLGVKEANGMVEIIRSDTSWVFDKTGEGYGYTKFMERSALLRRRSELAPSDTLTLTCTLRVNDGFNSAERLDTLSENLKDIFLSERDSDVTIKVKNQAFPVHKLLLTARSPVFAAMLEVDMKEKHMGTINIVDCDPEPFKYFLTYLYSGKLEKPSISTFELYKIADKYQVEELKSACVGFMMSNLSLENVCDAVLLVYNFNENTLKLKTQNFFNTNFSKIISTDEWISLMKENTNAGNEFLKNLASKMQLIE